ARPELKAVHKLIKRHILDRVPFPFCVHGYCPGRSQVTAARRHVGHPYLLSMDIQAFYPSVGHRAVNVAWTRLGAAPPVADLLTRLTTCDYQLPQGFTTSQALANLVRSPLDGRMVEMARQRNLTYTSFCDNLFLSGQVISTRIVETCRQIARCYRWRLHKVSLAGPDATKLVLGIVVGDELDITQEYYDSVVGEIAALQGRRRVSQSRVKRVKGMIGWVRQIAPDRAEILAGLLASTLAA
ncbi:MAG: reverse transcriptase family protein, partial [Armatimonadota bacterium]